MSGQNGCRGSEVVVVLVDVSELDDVTDDVEVVEDVSVVVEEAVVTVEDALAEPENWNCLL